jgi:transposase
MIVIGADTHKRTHALAAIDADTGQLLAEREITATAQGQLDGLCWAHELGQDIVWAVKDCRHVSQHFERSLVAAGERVLRVAPKLMGASRRGEREPGKSDQIDARAIAPGAAHAEPGRGRPVWAKAGRKIRADDRRRVTRWPRILTEHG